MPDRKLEEIIDRILRVIVPDKIILFGSRARGEARDDSDYDLLLIKSGIRSEDERAIAQDIYVNLIGVKAGVDVIVKTPENVEEGRKRQSSIVREATDEGVVVYG